MDEPIAILEKRVAELEKSASLFEEHRQSWERFCKSSEKLAEEWKREDNARRKRELEASEKRSTTWEQLRDLRSPADTATQMLREEMKQGFARLERALAELTTQTRNHS